MSMKPEATIPRGRSSDHRRVTPTSSVRKSSSGEGSVSAGDEDRDSLSRLEGSVGTPRRSESEGDGDDRMNDSSGYESEGYESVFEIDTRGFLDRYDLSNEQLKAMESHMLLGVDAAQKLINASIAAADTECQLADARLELRAAKSLIKFEKGWTDKYVDTTVEQAAIALRARDDEDRVSSDIPIQKANSHRVGTVVNVSANTQIPSINEVSPHSMQQLVCHLYRCERENLPDNRGSILTPTAQAQLHANLLSEPRNGMREDLNTYEWLTWSRARLLKALELTFPLSADSTDQDWVHLITPLRVSLDVRDEESYRAYLNQIMQITVQAKVKNTAEKHLVELLIKGLNQGKGKTTRGNKAMELELKHKFAEGCIPSLTGYVVEFRRICCRIRREMRAVAMWDNALDDPNGASALAAKLKRQRDEAHNKPAKKQKTGGSAQTQDNAPRCNGCGNKLPEDVDRSVEHHQCRVCMNHPDRNESGPFEESDAFKELQKRGHRSLLRHMRANGELIEGVQERRTEGGGKRHPGTAKGGKYGKKPFTGKKHGELSAMHSHELRVDFDDDVVNMELTIDGTHSLPVQVLVDSGASTENFVSTDVARWIRERGGNTVCALAPEVACSRSSVRLAGTDITLDTGGVVSCDVIFYNEVDKAVERLSCLQFRVLDGEHDCVLGLPTIRKYKLARKIPSYFEGPGEGAPSTVVSAPVLASEERKACSCAQPESSSSLWSVCGHCKDEGMSLLKSRSLVFPKVSTQSELSALRTPIIVEKDELLGDSIVDDDEIDWKDDPFDLPEEVQSSENEVRRGTILDKIEIHGTPQLQNDLRALCAEFSDIFSETVRAEPADVPPMEIRVDEEKWFTGRNRLPPRPQSGARLRAIQTQVELYKKLNVIEESNASAHSQVHMVPKPNPNEWRFCLDFVRLNEATIGTENWPIPNIPHMIQRIGAKKPKVFGVMDMTSGYHQAPLSIASRLLTAFICFVGLFHWLRVPMGLKNAAAYFQKVMATVVLSGILYGACELYIDDVFVFGKDDAEFVANLRKVFERFRKHRITINPKKVCLGQDHIEFVGHVINAEGISFSAEKREKVLNFPLPTKAKQLMGFIGLVNYFRDHVDDMTSKLKDLRGMLGDRKKALAWTPELEQKFNYVKNAVAQCPSLWFLDESGPVFVLTDASDYGIGAYIYQKVDGQERPVIFLSKALQGAQLNWSTIEKEAYAIFYTLKTYEYLLRDVKFTLRTDHMNLTYLNVESTQKVRRWKLFIQEFNFDVEHIPGEENVVADAFSRLCVRESSENDSSKPFSLSLIGEDDIRIPDVNYNQIRNVHNATVGHFGVEETIARLHSKGETWKHMRKHVRQFIRKCNFCQANSQKKLTAKVLPYTRASYHPMEVINVDTIGPLPKDEYGNEYLLVIIDCFTRWVELYSTPDTSAMSAAVPLLQHCGRFGVPALIRSDRGSQFVNELIGQLSELFLTDQELTTAYSKERNAIVERANKEVMRHLRAIVYDERISSQWSAKQIPLVMRILNSEEKTRTGVSPAELLFGNAVDLGRYLLYRPTASLESDRNLNEHLEKMLERQAELIRVAQETQLKHDTHHMSRNDPELTDYPVNSYVLWENPAGGRNKLQTKLQGPFQVVRRVDDDITILDLLTNKEIVTHISNVREFNFDPDRTDPKEVALHSSEEFVIESILEHSGDKTRRNTMQFKVRWLGYGPEHDSWEPYKNLRDTEQLHTYLRANRMTTLIPSKHK